MNGCNDCSCLWMIMLLLCCGYGTNYNNNCCGGNAVPYNQGNTCGCCCSCNFMLPLLITWLFYGNGSNYGFNSCGCGCGGNNYDYNKQC